MPLSAGEEEKDDPEIWGDIWRVTLGYWIVVPLTRAGDTYCAVAFSGIGGEELDIEFDVGRVIACLRTKRFA